MHERRGADGISRWGKSSDRAGRVYEEERAENATVMEPYKWYPQRAGRADLVIERARATGRASDPLVRQEIARLVALQRASQWTAERARTARAAGRAPGPEGSIGKLATSLVARQAARTHAAIDGASALLTG